MLAQADKSAAEALFRAAKALEHDGNIAEACPKYVESQRLDPKPGTALNVATCHEAVGRTATAWADYSEAATFAARAKQPEREAFARDKLAELEKKLSYLTIVFSETKGLEATLDGKPLAAAASGTRIPLDPGDHELEAHAPGRVVWTEHVALADGPTERTVEIPLLAEAATAPVEPRREVTSEPSPLFRTLGWVGVGVGVVSLGVGAGFGLRTLGEKSTRDEHCLGSQCDQVGVDADRAARAAATVSTVTFIAGAALLGAGVALLVIAPKQTVRLRAGLGSGSAAFAW